MSETIYIAGIDMTVFGPQPDKSVVELTRSSVEGALKDAGASMEDVEIAFFSNAGQGIFEGQHNIRGQVALRQLGLQGKPVINVENACASGSTAVHQAIQAIKAGQADIALAVGTEKMCYPDKAKVLSAFDGGWDVHNREATTKRLLAMGQGVDCPEVEGERSVFMDIYASFARGHMKAFGTTQQQLAVVSSKNHFNSSLNPHCHYRKEMSVEEILSARALAFPLTVPMCAPVSDGSAAVVICNQAGLKKLGSSRAVSILSCVLVSGIDREDDDWQNHITRLAARQAYEQAGIGPMDVNVAEVHDASAIGEIIQTENLGLCDTGCGGEFAESGATALGGRVPVNTSGGLESKGHPIGATGIGQLYELVTQLRGDAGKRQVQGAKVAVAENGGGVYGVEEACAVVTLLAK